MKSNLDRLVERARQRAAIAQAAAEKQLSFAEIQRRADGIRNNNLAKAKGTPVLPQVTHNLRLGKNNKPNKVTKSVPRQPFQSKPGMEYHSREPYVEPSYEDIYVPDWFKIPTDQQIDVSIIVPMFRSAKEILEQVISWDLQDDGLKKEIIYVSDACPQHSENEVLKAWTGKSTGIGKIIKLSINAGYATACNVGSLYAKGKHLIFLNADTTVTPNWVKPMYDLMELDQTIGIIGNMQLRDDGVIDSAGSEWMWDNKMFEHIGRNVYKGNRLVSPILRHNMPEELKMASERDMVTGCCFMIPAELFARVKGFDIGYRIGYWEDSDLNMKVKEQGYKIYFQPESVIFHKSGHSRAGLHPFIMDNVRKFYKDWVDNRKIDGLVKSKRP